MLPMNDAQDASPQQDYAVFGLRVRSNLPLPELTRAEGDAPADVTITTGPIPEAEHAAPGLTSVDGALILLIPNVGRYRIETGDRITLDPDPDVPARNVRLFLFGSAFGALLHQRGLLPLHATAVEIAGSAFAFMGHSGAGKSTLAAWFHDNGQRILADDVCVVRFDAEGRPIACPGLPHLRLWPDAMHFTGRRADDFRRSYVGADGELEKFDIPIGGGEALRPEAPVAAIYLLQRGSRFAIEQLTGVAAAQAVFENTYRGSFLSAASARHSHWQSALRLVQTTDVFAATREWSLDRLPDQCRALLAHARSLLD